MVDILTTFTVFPVYMTSNIFVLFDVKDERGNSSQQMNSLNETNRRFVFRDKAIRQLYH